MQLIKYMHACVRLEHEGRALVIDPGTWTEADALDGVSDVLITHEHFDHVDADRLTALAAANPALKIYAHATVVEQLKGVGASMVPVASGDEFQAAGFQVRAVGGEHAEIYDGLPGIPNLGFVIDIDATDGGLYHPGDSFFVPEVPVSTLLVPASGPWMKLAEALDFVRAVAPRRAHPVHDALLTPAGEQIFDNFANMKTNTNYTRIPTGDSVSLNP